MIFGIKQQYQQYIQLASALVALLLSSCAPQVSNKSQESNSEDENPKVSVSIDIDEQNEYSVSIKNQIYMSAITCTALGTKTYSTPVDIVNSPTLILNDRCTLFTFSPSYPVLSDSNDSYYPIAGKNSITASGQSIQLATSPNSSTVALTANVKSTSVFNVTSTPSFTFTFGTAATNPGVIDSSGIIAPMIGSGDEYSCALVFQNALETSDNEKVYCWGNNSNLFPSQYTTPTDLSTISSLNLPSDIKKLFVGDELMCVLTGSGALYCLGYWGASHTSFTQITGYPSGSITNVSLGYQSGCALTSGAQNVLYCWGNIDFEGNGSLTYYSGNNSLYLAAFDLGNVITNFAVANDVSAYTYNGGTVSGATRNGSVCVLLTTQAIKCVGGNAFYQLGNNSSTASTSPVTVTGLTGTIVKLVAKNQTYCAINSSNTTYCWGQANDFKSPVNSNVVYEYNMFGPLTSGAISSSNPASIGGGSFYSTKRTAAALGGKTQYATLTSSQTSYNSWLATATSINTKLSSISVGQAGFCGAKGPNVLCFGVDFTTASSLTTYDYTTQTPKQTSYARYDYGNLGYVTASNTSYTANYTDSRSTNYTQTCYQHINVNNSISPSNMCYSHLTNTPSPSCGQISNFDTSVDGNYTDCDDWHYASLAYLPFGLSCSSPAWWFSTIYTPIYFNSCYKYNSPFISSYKDRDYCNSGSALSQTNSNNSYTSVGALQTNSYCTSNTAYPYTGNYTGILYTPFTTTATRGNNNLTSTVYSVSVGSNYQNTNSIGHVCVSLVNGTVYCWGGNDVGQVGNGTATNPISTPTIILSPNNSGFGGTGY